MTPFLLYMHGTHLTFGKLLVRKRKNILVVLIVSAKSVEVPIELSDNHYCNLSLPIPNELTLEKHYFNIIIHDYNNNIQNVYTGCPFGSAVLPGVPVYKHASKN